MPHSKAQSPTPPSFPEVWALFKSLQNCLALSHTQTCQFMCFCDPAHSRGCNCLTPFMLWKSFVFFFFLFSTELSGSYKCKAWSLSSCMSSLVQRPVLVPYVLLNIIFDRILNLEAKKPLENICLKLKQFFTEWFVSIPPWDVYHKFHTEIHGWWESENILIFVFICTYFRFYKKYE